MGSRKGKRNRERRTRAALFEAAWVWGDREEVRARLDARGVLHTVVYRPQGLPTVARMYAAEWLRVTFLSRLTFHECYRELWGEAF